MALAERGQFLPLDPPLPAHVRAPYRVVADPKGAAKHAHTVGAEEMHPIDLVVCGSVAVNRRIPNRPGLGRVAIGRSSGDITSRFPH